MGQVKGVILDESALLLPGDCDHASIALRPGADFLFRSLQYSKLRIGISYAPELPSNKIDFLKRISSQYSIDCFSFCACLPDDSINNIRDTWSDDLGNILHLICGNKQEPFLKLGSCAWLLVILGENLVLPITSYDDGGRCRSETSPHISYIRKLEELPLQICHLNKKEVEGVMTIGYIMKASRQADFSKRGAFPLKSSQNGLIFLPFTYEIPIAVQLQELDAVLHKATDYISSIELSSASSVGPRITYSNNMEKLKRSLEQQQNCQVIDPFDNLIPILDRLEIQHLLLGLEELVEEFPKIRGPRFLKVDKFDELNWTEELSKAMLSFPNIVKPQVACGVSDAHSMAIVFRSEDYAGLTVPLPAIVQEYVDHSSTIYKVYVLGERVFHAVKKSIPNAIVLKELLSQANELGPLLFDSLKSLPTASGNIHEGETDAKKCEFDLVLVTKAANWLQRKLGLTIFGFDVVVQEGTSDHVIVDVNYLPSFKEVPDDVAIPALWDAIRRKVEKRTGA